MKKRHKKYLNNFFFFGIPLLAILGAIAYTVLPMFKNNNQNKVTETTNTTNKKKTDNKIDKKFIFPDLDKEIIYNKIRIKKPMAIITDEMIWMIHKYILSNAKVPQGQIYFNHSRIDDQNVYFTYKATIDDQEIIKNYKVNLSKIS